MRKIIYNKLVRDKIPEIIKNQKEIPNTRILDEEEYPIHLEMKLEEEIEEYRQNHDLEELADILEVLYALCESDGHSIEELQAMQKKKQDERGGFTKRIFLLSKESEH